MGGGPQASKPGELRAGTTECDFLSISMTLANDAVVMQEFFSQLQL